MTLVRRSLFDRPPGAESGPASGPAPGSGSALGEAGAWLGQLLGGSVAVALCLIAVALLGYLMLTGRLPLRRGAQVVLGCFLLLGGPLLARDLLGRFQQVDMAAAQPAVIVPAQPLPEPPPPAQYDPYAGASLRSLR